MERQLKAIIESSPLGASIFSMTEGQRVLSNSKAIELFGAKSEEEFANFDVTETFFDASDAAVLDEHSPEVLGVPRREIRRRVDGSLWVSQTTRQRIELDGQDVFLIWYEDVTERELSEERFRRVFNIPTMPMALYRSADKSWIDYNEAFFELFGYDREEMSKLTWVELTHPDDLQMNLSEFDEAAKNPDKTSYTLRKRFVHKSGRVIHSRIHTEHIRSTDHRNAFVVLVVDDISEDVAREERLEEMAKSEASLRRHADAANDAKSQFLAAMSHEIRTPLTALMGMADLLEMTKLNEDQKQFVSTLKSASSHLSTVINDILDLSKMEADKVDLKPKFFSITSLITPPRVMYRALATSNGLHFELNEELPQENLLVYGDMVRTRQILMNLLSNAIKFTPQGEVVATVSVEAADGQDAAQIRIVVRDSGVGISPEVQKEIFSPFTQADQSRTKSFAGTGLGLAICKRLVDQMEGTISIESEEGKGATFTVTLPTELKIDNLVEIEPPEEPVSSSGPASVDRLRILVAEDDEVNRAMVSRMFKKWGCRAEFVVDGEAAVAAMRANQYDLIFLDIHMPRMSGLEVLESEQKSDRVLPPVYAFTADVMAERIQEYEDAGFSGCIEKPFDWDAMKEIIDGVVKG